MTQSTTRTLLPPADVRRLRLTACLALYGAALGAATVLVSLLTRTKPWLEPQHPGLLLAVLLSLSGVLAGLLITSPAVYWLGERAREPRGLLIWLAFGFGYGVLLPFFTGAFLPLSVVFIDLSLGVTAVGDLLTETLNAALRAPLSSFVHGALGLLTGLLAGALFGGGAWLIDRANASSDAITEKYGTWSVTLILASTALTVTLFGPLEILAKLH